jgi:hypothetical protein
MRNQRLPVNALAKKVFGMICRQTGSSMLVTAHPSKARMQNGTFYAGSTAWNGVYRSRLVLRADQDEPDKRILSLAKANYSSAEDIELYMALDCWFDGDRPAMATKRTASAML